MRTDRIKTCPLTFSHNLQYFLEALVGLTAFAAFSRIWVSWYLKTCVTCHLELDSQSPTILFLVPFNDLGLSCWILPHIHKHISCPAPQRKFLSCLLLHQCFLVQRSKNVYTKTPDVILHGNLSSWLNLLCKMAIIALLLSKLSEEAVLHLAEGIQGYNSTNLFYSWYAPTNFPTSQYSLISSW